MRTSLKAIKPASPSGRPMSMNDKDFSDVKTAFEAHDKDGNGYLDREEFVVMLRNLGSKLTDAQIEVGFRLVDEDNSGRINLSELERWWGIVSEERNA